MSSYNSILKWAQEAKTLLKQGNTSSTRVNLSMIISQAKEEIKKQEREERKKQGKTSA